jgi:hypothetical protein
MKNLFKMFFITIPLIFLLGCAYSISEIDTSDYEPKCVRECTKAYSECVSVDHAGFHTETLRACKESYKQCINTCPEK